MHQFVNLTLIGITTGAVYAAVAMGLVLIWRATRTVNFAQGAMATFSTYVAATLIDRNVSYWLALVAAIVTGLIIGTLTERLLMRPIANTNQLNPVIIAIGMLIVLEAVSGMIWGAKYREFPSNFSVTGIKVGTSRIALSAFDIYVMVAVLVLMVALLVLFRWTSLGLKMRAAAFSPEIARLLGVRVGRMLTLGWALAVGMASVAGVLAAPNVLLYPNNMDGVNVFAFTAAILGGLDSPVGALVGGLGMGFVVSYVGGYLGSSLETIGGLIVLLIVLSFRPQGIFAASAARRV